MIDDLGSEAALAATGAVGSVGAKHSTWLNAHALAGAASLNVSKKQQSEQVPVDIDHWPSRARS